MIFFCQSYYFEASPVASRKIHIYFSSKRRVYDSLIVRYCHYFNNSVCAGITHVEYAVQGFMQELNMCNCILFFNMLYFNVIAFCNISL